MASYEKVRGGKFSFKGGGDLGVSVNKQKKKKKKSDKNLPAAGLDLDARAREEGEGAPEASAGTGAGTGAMSVGTGIGGDPGGDAKGTYEELFPYELKRQHDGKGRSQCWGTNYREAPEVLHGYTESWKKKKAADMGIEERLDLRCGSKADKFCK
mmetsp:Transcript_25811/g.64606  ORF Transcript_25811/g.64606 Transcript_25811/m.64606 type:complete len:155 (-) Transcript_25811:79-543(-)|eukprot:CAMPEP_0181370858 /NCGR_PEP_ID=MMETSP1106-20121128/13693_1 /TAXON_ID=81844 /ORGANISM="Mantoniella antarctica, Strain SL-175" /LENGTH=154 /DNA_ID=CAMNT_0023487765 /DNA_START=208 /DNA_END=672 /DNA_ORIENTATION=-